MSIQAKLLEDYRNFYTRLCVLLKEQPDDVLNKLKDSDQKILTAIQQGEWTYTHEAKVEFEQAFSGVRQQVDLLHRLYSVSHGEIIFIPDTNALLYNPDLDKWRFENVSLFTILLTPTVLAELDSLKVNYRVESIRDKAEKIIRLVKEYRRRGEIAGKGLINGVPLVKGISKIKSIAIEPNMDKTLPWLDSQNNDDRLLASIIEAMRLYAHSSVLLITRDINLQNKAEFARVPYTEPPDIN